MAKRIDTVTITIDAQAAREEMSKLKKRSDELGKAIAEMKKQLEDPGLQKTSAQWKQLNKQYKDTKQEQKELNNLIAEGEQSIKGMNDVLSNLSKATYNDLIKQQRTLSRAIKSAKPNTKDYKELQTALRAVNNRVDELRKGWAAHDSQIVAVAKRLASYVAIYGGFNFVVGKLKSVVSETLKLSDAMADVQKTTGIAGRELRMLSKDIDLIDTRTSQLEMHSLAAVAGQIGFTETQVILGFVNAANQLTVALNELGQDGVQSLSKIAQLTGDIELLGVEKSLLAIGSSINELSANSAASAGPIADFMRRVGGVAPIANLATSDLAALGATADALGQQMEVSGTALSKFIMSVVNNTSGIAYALNMEEEALRDLIDTGQTMEAIIRILEAVKNNSDLAGSAMTDMFKEFGSEGQRMSNVIQTLANNTNFLRQQVELSGKAFDEATSATNEYNVKNENAAAIAQRIANEWQEFFVNADNTKLLTGLLNKLLDLTKFLTGASNGMAVLRATFLSLIAAISSSKLGITQLFNALGQLITGVKLTDSAFIGHIRTLMTAKRATAEYRAAVTALGATMKAFMAANWFTLILSGLTAIVTLVRRWNLEQRELNASIAELNSELVKEKSALDEVCARLHEVKDSDKERAELVKDINRNYGSLLGNLLDEAAGYREIASALDLVNEKLDLKFAKQIYEKSMEKPNEEFTKEAGKAKKDVIGWLKGTVGETAATVYEDLREAISEVASGMDETIGNFDNIGGTLDEIFIKTEALRGYKWQDLPYEDGIRRLLNAQIEWNNAHKAATEEQRANVELQQGRVSEAQKGYLEAIKTQMKELAQLPEETINAMKEDELKKHYERIINYSNTLIKDAQRQYDAYVKAMPRGPKETDDAYNARLKAKQEELFGDIRMEDIRKAYAGDAWNKAYNLTGWKNMLKEKEKLATANVESLVKTYKEMEEATAKFNDPEALGKVFEKDFKTIQEAQQFIFKLSEEIRLALKAQGRNTSGGFLREKDGSGTMETQVRRDVEAAKSALEAYYREQERIINDAYLAQEISAAEHDRRLAHNQQEMKRSFVDLYSTILGETKKYNTDFDKILPGKNLQLLSEQMQKWGVAMVDGMKNARAESETDIQVEAIKMREIIEKALLEGDMFGKLTEQFRETLDELSLLAMNFGKTFDAVDERTAKELVAQLTGMADEAYTMTEKELLAEAKKRSKGNEILTAWWSGVDDNQLTLILEKLKIYYDNRLDMQRKYAQRMQREWLQNYKQTGAQAEYEANKRMIEEAGSTPEGYVKGAGDYNEERGVIAAEAALEVEKIDSNIAFLQDKLKARALSINQDLATIVEAERAVLYALDPNSEEYAAQKAFVEELENRAVNLATKSGDAEAVALNASIVEQTQEMNAIIQQSEIETTNVTLEQWQKRAEALGEWAEMVGETMGEVYMLERQANNARARGDEETAKKLEAQAKESRQNLVKEALNKAIDMAKVWAMELGFKVMYNSLAQKSDEKLAAASANATVKEVLADIIAQGFKGAGKEIGSKGIAGLITGGAIIAAAAGLAALAKSAVANMYPEATEGVNDATAPKRKLTTGMLTYAEGRYPVLGNDGVVYDAQYAGDNMKTGVYRKPHFGIFAEKQPEMVIDGKTTQRLVLNYPEVYNGILHLSRTGRMGMRTYNDGNVSEFAAVSAQQQIQMEEMRMTMAATAAALAALTQRLDQPINATVNRYGRGGSLEAERKAQRWESRNRV